MLKILVCGGRNYHDWHKVNSVLDTIHHAEGVAEIIHGSATGADRLADYWAEKNNVSVKRYPANWRKHGRSAGPIRNALMVDDNDLDLVLAFPGGSGTKNMVNVAKAAGVQVMRVAPGFDAPDPDMTTLPHQPEDG